MVLTHYSFMLQFFIKTDNLVSWIFMLPNLVTQEASWKCLLGSGCPRLYLFMVLFPCLLIQISTLTCLLGQSKHQDQGIQQVQETYKRINFQTGCGVVGYYALSRVLWGICRWGFGCMFVLSCIPIDISTPWLFKSFTYLHSSWYIWTLSHLTIPILPHYSNHLHQTNQLHQRNS